MKGIQKPTDDEIRELLVACESMQRAGLRLKDLEADLLFAALTLWDRYGELELEHDLLRKQLEEERNQNWNLLTESQKDEAIRKA